MTCLRNKNSETFESMGKQLAREKEGEKNSDRKINQKLSPCQHCVMKLLINYFQSRRYLFFMCPMIAQYRFEFAMICDFFSLSHSINFQDDGRFTQRPRPIFMTLNRGESSWFSLNFWRLWWIQFASSIDRWFATNENWEKREKKPWSHELPTQKKTKTVGNKSQINIKKWKVPLSDKEFQKRKLKNWKNCIALVQ